jgi:vacuolar-type H+-ATPase subunit I/STV1
MNMNTIEELEQLEKTREVLCGKIEDRIQELKELVHATNQEIKDLNAQLKKHKVKVYWGDKISETKKKMKENGLHPGGKVPFGYDLVDGKLIENRKEKESIVLMRDWREEGLSYRKIEGKLKELGIDLSYTSIRNILTN